MSELAQQLLAVIQRGPVLFSDLWAEIPCDYSFYEMQAGLAELIEAGKIEQIADTFAFRLATAA